jgi:signal transduction histidine kinase
MKFTDTGCGISKDDLANIFNPFFTTKPPGKGTGLGLSICLTILERLGGTVSVQSEPGKGTTFAVRLPVGRRVGQ